MQIGILEPSDFSKVAIEKLDNVGQVTKFSGKDLSIFLRDKDVLFIRLGYVISKDFMKDFILINLNQNISKARHAAIKKEKNKWIIFLIFGIL